MDHKTAVKDEFQVRDALTFDKTEVVELVHDFQRSVFLCIQDLEEAREALKKAKEEGDRNAIIMESGNVVFHECSLEVAEENLQLWLGLSVTMDPSKRILPDFNVEEFCKREGRDPSEFDMDRPDFKLNGIWFWDV